MKNWKIVSLLLLGLLAFTQNLFAESADAGPTPEADFLFSPQQKTFYSFLTGTYVTADNASQLFPANPSTDKTYWFEQGAAKYKKRFKRFYSFSTKLERPVKDIDLLPVNIFTKETYSKPHFLSHLHQFLFRLTPF